MSDMKTKMTTVWVLFALFMGQALKAQVQLKMDKPRQKTSLVFEEGDVITVRLKGEEMYQTFQIEKLYPEVEMIQTQLGPIYLKDIERLRTREGKNMGKYLSASLFTFGTAWGGFSLIAFLLAGEPLTWSVLVVAGVSYGLGLLLLGIFRGKTYKIGKRRKLRMVDFGLLGK